MSETKKIEASVALGLSPVSISRKLLVWKDISTRTVAKSMIIGHFTMWAVRQSPYFSPDSLEKGMKEFDQALECDELDCIVTTCKGLEKIVSDAISKSNIIQSWNIPKSGEAPPYLFVTRYSKLEPDIDFIDLDAMARNITHSVWLEVCYDNGFFEGGEK